MLMASVAFSASDSGETIRGVFCHSLFRGHVHLSLTRVRVCFPTRPLHCIAGALDNRTKTNIKSVYSYVDWVIVLLVIKARGQDSRPSVVHVDMYCH